MYDHAIMPRYIEMGARFILAGNDASFVMASARSRSAFLRGVTPG